MSVQVKPAGSFWQDYLFLTREMHRFLLQNNLDMFFLLIDEREKLQAVLAGLDSGQFIATAEGKQLIREIEQENAIILSEMRKKQNELQKQEELANAYNTVSRSNIGISLDQKG